MKMDRVKVRRSVKETMKQNKRGHATGNNGKIESKAATIDGKHRRPSKGVDREIQASRDIREEHARPEPQAPSPPPDLLAATRQAMAGVSDEEINQTDENIKLLRQQFSRAFGGNGMSPERDRQALRYLLAKEVRNCLLRTELIRDAMAFKERLRTAKSTSVIRAARQTYRNALESLQREGAPADIVEELSRLAL